MGRRMKRAASPALRDNALTTLEAVKVAIGIDLAEEDAQRDAALVQLINAASAWLESKLGRKLGRQTYTENKAAPGTQRLTLEQYPIISITSVTDTLSGAAVDGFDFSDEGEIGVVFRENGWTYRGHIGGLSYDFIAPRRYLQIVYTAGYVLPKDATADEPATLPADLEGLVWDMVSQAYANMQNGSQGLKSFSISDVSWTFDKSTPSAWLQIVNLYRRY